jgi:hypothetical protein
MEFLFDNPLLLFALIGIISSVFKRLKGDSPEGQKQKQRGPFTQSTQPLNPRPIERKKPIVRTKPLDEMLQDMRKSAEQMPIEQPLEKPVTVKKVPAHDQNPMKNKDTIAKKKSSYSVNQSKLVDGIIWSEVLGPPRSKNPHTAIRPRQQVRR